MEGASGPISENMNTDTHLLSKKATGIILKLRKHWNLEKIINSVYELSSTAQVIRWYHAAAGYPSPGSKQLRQDSLQLGHACSRCRLQTLSCIKCQDKRTFALCQSRCTFNTRERKQNPQNQRGYNESCISLKQTLQ